jgi:hypothetical protein
MPRTLALCACAFLAAAPAIEVAAQGPAAAVETLAPRATGLCLAEVVEISEHDARPSDGNREVLVKLRKVKGSGECHDVLTIITAYSGGGQGPPPKPPTFLRPDTFRKGGQYWIAFASGHEYEKHPQGVVAFWPKGSDAKAEAVLEEALRADVYRWSPRYDPQTKLTYGRMADATAPAGEKRWRIQVQRAGKTLWEKAVPGAMSTWSQGCWKLDESAPTNFPGKVPACGKMLVAETILPLGPQNEFGLPPQLAHIQTGYDPETGDRLTAKVMKHERGLVFTLLYREYHPKTGAVEKETR